MVWRRRLLSNSATCFSAGLAADCVAHLSILHPHVHPSIPVIFPPVHPLTPPQPDCHVFLAELDCCFSVFLSSILQVESNAWRWAINISGQWCDRSLDSRSDFTRRGENKLTHSFRFLWPFFLHFLFSSRGQMHKALLPIKHLTGLNI